MVADHTSWLVLRHKFGDVLSHIQDVLTWDYQEWCTIYLAGGGGGGFCDTYSTYYKPLMYYKPTPSLFRADVRKIAHGLIIRTLRYMCFYHTPLKLLTMGSTGKPYRYTHSCKKLYHKSLYYGNTSVVLLSISLV